LEGRIFYAIRIAKDKKGIHKAISESVAIACYQST
jgi:hypothetical protein